MSPPASTVPVSACRILVRGADRLGDAVLTLPALDRLRERFPEGRMALLTRENLADLWRRHPALDEVITINSGESPFSVTRQLRLPTTGRRHIGRPHRRWGRWNLIRSGCGVLNTLWETAAGVISDRFDVALVLSESPRAALEVWLARIPVRIGYARRGGNWELTRVLPP